MICSFVSVLIFQVFFFSVFNFDSTIYKRPWSAVANVVVCKCQVCLSAVVLSVSVCWISAGQTFRHKYLDWWHNKHFCGITPYSLRSQRMVFGIQIIQINLCAIVYFIGLLSCSFSDYEYIDTSVHSNLRNLRDLLTSVNVF